MGEVLASDGGWAVKSVDEYAGGGWAVKLEEAWAVKLEEDEMAVLLGGCSLLDRNRSPCNLLSYKA